MDYIRVAAGFVVITVCILLYGQTGIDWSISLSLAPLKDVTWALVLVAAVRVAIGKILQ